MEVIVIFKQCHGALFCLRYSRGDARTSITAQRVPEDIARCGQSGPCYSQCRGSECCGRGTGDAAHGCGRGVPGCPGRSSVGDCGPGGSGVGVLRPARPLAPNNPVAGRAGKRSSSAISFGKAFRRQRRRSWLRSRRRSRRLGWWKSAGRSKPGLTTLPHRPFAPRQRVNVYR